MKLYDYFRSSAAFRVRMALNYKQIDYNKIPIDLRLGVQQEENYKNLNPIGLVPCLITNNNENIHQSLAIIEYLEENYPDRPLLPKESIDRSYVRSISLDIACDIHPLNNLRVWGYLLNDLKISEIQKNEWYKHWVGTGLKALEEYISKAKKCGSYCFKDQFTLADICLVAQLFNARRFNFDLNPYPILCKIDENCQKLEAVTLAFPKE
ncbi:MAG TPA: maleylacetoacetate isomerase [Burkholderiales bacterium]|nr:maleylacetoacetate isomerase [Burkholderiales bacterium]